MIVKTAICAIMSWFLLVPNPDVEQNTAETEKPKVEKPEQVEESPDIKLVEIEKNIVQYTNAQRKRRGLAELKVDAGLMNSARSHCAWMARKRRMVHTRQPVAENIAMGQPNSSAVVQSWMRSSGHRANILNRGYRYIGVASYRSPSGSIYWCQQFRR